MNRRPTTLSDPALVALTLFLFAGGCLLVALDQPLWLIDLARSYVLILGSMMFVAAVLIARVFYRNYRAAPETARLLPRHVVQLGATLALQMVPMLALMIDLVGGSPRWYSLPFGLASVTLGCFGLWDMLRWLPKRNPRLHATGEMGDES